jgi:peptidoglycan/LPS O-acetylase OafA/YrhL
MNQHLARNSPRRIDDIEMLRGVSIIFVIIHHSHGNLLVRPRPLFDLFHSYFGLGVGVDIFFAISGFVIARQLVPVLLECENRSQQIGQLASFWLRRVWRLLPSAWLWLGLILLASIFLNRSGAFGSIRANYEATIAGVLQVANFRFADSFGRTEYGASFAYWSLSLEEQFYLIFPLLILITRKKLAWALAIIAVAQLVNARSLLTLSLRTDALALGALIALWQAHSTYILVEPAFMRRRWIRWPVVAALLIFIGSLGAPTIHVIPYGFSLIALLSAALVLLASYDRDYTTPPAVLKPILMWTGSRSYALYLIHVPAFFLTREIFYRAAQAGMDDGFEHALPIVATFIVIAVGAAEINYRWVEVPLRRYGAGVAERVRQRAAVVAPVLANESKL